MIEKVTRLETSMVLVQETIKQSVEDFKEMRKEMNASMLEIRADITNGILRRYPGHIVLIITILTAVCTALLTAYLHKL
jgi:hypothetical protein